jgi:hypothetical protein
MVDVSFAKCYRYDELTQIAEWVVHAPQGGVIEVMARHDRAGSISTEIALDALSESKE